MADPARSEAVIREWHHLVGEERIKYELGASYIEDDFIEEVAQVAKAVCQILCKSWQPGSLAGIGIFLNVNPRITA